MREKKAKLKRITVTVPSGGGRTTMSKGNPKEKKASQSSICPVSRGGVRDRSGLSFYTQGRPVLNKGEKGLAISRNTERRFNSCSERRATLKEVDLSGKKAGMEDKKRNGLDGSKTKPGAALQHLISGLVMEAFGGVAWQLKD